MYKEYSALTLAYIGDAVFEIMSRKKVLSEGEKPVKKLHTNVKNIVNAISQAKMYAYIYEFLTEEEKSVIQRGRNAKSMSASKNAPVIDYRHATGLEALFGYIYLKGDINRLEEIFGLCLKAL
ncbi:MAG: ribonuclease III [Clostridiales bacterium]|jgi:ribonuclease-3 family protein|nr:ribonuclease III [Clostridiales bacterium]